jgi:DNA-binding PadR family transcriptional regulator
MGQDLPVTSYALLGLLTFGDELTGYELKQRADVTLRFYWVSPAMSQIYSELGRLTEHGLVEPHTRTEGARSVTTYAITDAGQKTLRVWMDTTPAGFPTLKHTVCLRLLMGHAGDPDGIRAMVEEYVEQLEGALCDLRGVRESLRGVDARGQSFHHAALVADWGLDYFAAEQRHARSTLARMDDPEYGGPV